MTRNIYTSLVILTLVILTACDTTSAQEVSQKNDDCGISLSSGVSGGFISGITIRGHNKSICFEGATGIIFSNNLIEGIH